MTNTGKIQTHKRCARCGENRHVTSYGVFFTSRSGTGWVSRHCENCLTFSGMEGEAESLREELREMEEEAQRLKEKIKETRSAIRSIEKRTFTVGEDD